VTNVVSTSISGNSLIHPPSEDTGDLTMRFSIIADYTVNLSRALLLDRNVCPLVCPSFLWKPNENNSYLSWRYQMTEINGNGRHVCMVLLCLPFSRKEILLQSTYSLKPSLHSLKTPCVVLYLRVKKIK
jgi:hypothetical protein